MPGRLRYFGLLLLIAAPFVWGVAAAAEQGAPAAPSAAQNSYPSAGVSEAWSDECPERQDIREERERIRAAFEELDADHDRLKVQCMDAKGQQRIECNKSWEQFRMRKTALHERQQALKEKIAADAGCHREHAGPAGTTAASR